MNVSLALILLLAGVDGDGPRFQAQVGYELTILAIGNDLSFQAGMFDFSSLLYSPHLLHTKIGVQFEKGWEIRSTGGVSFSKFVGNPPLWLATDPDRTFVGWGDVSTLEFSAGIEGGHSLRFPWGEGSLYLGVEGIYGRLNAIDTLEEWWNWDPPKEKIIWPVYVTTPVAGYRWYVGISIPVVTVNQFSLQIHPLIMGGKVKTGDPVTLSANTKWFGPCTLLKRGVGIGLTLNYNEGKKR